MKKKLTALVIAGALALSACGDSEEMSADERVASYTDDDSQLNGSDSHVTIDPVKEDPNIAATAVASILFTWNPSEQATIYHIDEDVISEHFTGELADRVRDFDSEQAHSQTPEDWLEWAKDGVRVQAIIPNVEVTDDSDENARTTAVNVEQFLVDSEGNRTLYQKNRVIVHLVAEDDIWKADLMESIWRSTEE